MGSVDELRGRLVPFVEQGHQFRIAMVLIRVHDAQWQTVKKVFTPWWMGDPGLNKKVKSAGPCLPSLLRPEKMPGYANKQGAPALNAVNILKACPIISLSSVSQASVNEKLGFGNDPFPNIAIS